jgi:hypothetical protein
MSVNKNESQHTILGGASISATTRIVVIHDPGTGFDDYTILWGDLSGTNGLLYAINEAINNVWLDTTIAAGATGGITLGLAATYRKIFIEYAAERGTTCFRGGVIEVIHDGSTCYATDISQDTIDEEERGDKWLRIVDSVAVSGGQIVLNIAADSIDADPTYIKYRIKTRIPVHS